MFNTYRVSVSSLKVSGPKFKISLGAKYSSLIYQTAFIGSVDLYNDNYIFISHLLLISKIYEYLKRNNNVLNITSFIQKVASVESLERFSIDHNKHKAVFQS